MVAVLGSEPVLLVVAEEARMVVVTTQAVFEVEGFRFRPTFVLFSEPEKGGFYRVCNFPVILIEFFVLAV